jgi:hypothetical protein
VSPEEAINEFLQVLLQDRERNSPRTRAEYLALFPGFEAEIAGELDGQQDSPRARARESGHIGPYALLQEIGRGAQGRVWLAEDTRLGRKVAIKIQAGLGRLSELARLRFLREAEIVSKLEHPGICPLYEAGEEGGELYLALRYLSGETLARRLERAPAPPRTRAELERVLRWVEEAARAVHAAHEAGIVHRDLKPGNVMITAEGRAVVLDFGTARDVDGRTLTLSNELFQDALAIPPADPEALAGLLLCTGDSGLLERQAEVFASHSDLEWLVMYACVDDVYDGRIRALYERIRRSKSPLAVFIEGLGRLQGFDLGVPNTGRMGEFLVHTLIESKHARQLLRYRDEFQDYRFDAMPAADPARHLIRVIDAPDGDRVLGDPAGLGAAGDVDGDGRGDVLVSYARGYPRSEVFAQVFSGRTGEVLRTYARQPLPEPAPLDSKTYDAWEDSAARVVPLPDLDGDGVNEHVLRCSVAGMCAPGTRIELRSGRSGELLQDLALEAEDGNDMLSLSPCPDVDRDSRPELLIMGTGVIDV